MAKTKTQQKNYQSWREGRRKLEDDNLFSKYSNRFKRKKEVSKGKWVDWDIRTDAPWNPEAAWNTIYQNVYGTETPAADNKYLQAKELFDNYKSRGENDAWQQIRRQFSPKTVNEGERQIDIKRNETTLQKEAELRALRQDSSFRIDHESVPNWEGGVFEPTDETESLTDQALSRDEEVGENPNYFQQLGGIDQGYWMNGQWISNMTDVDRQNLKDFSIWKNGAIEKKKLEQTGGQEYVTDYQTAIQNSRRDGLSFGEAEQYYGEDVLDSAGNRVRKSNVFTLDEDGNPMGVKTRKQRLALDLAKAEAAIPKPDTTEDKKEDTSTEIKTEPNVGSEIKNTGEGGKIFEGASPLDLEDKILVG